MKGYRVLGGGTTWLELDLSKNSRMIVFGFEGLTFFLNQKKRRKNCCCCDFFVRVYSDSTL